MNNRVELVYNVGCPNVDRARESLLQACARAGVAPSWVEWGRKLPESPAHIRGYGSPTILVDGKDVAGAEPSQREGACRLYPDGATGFGGIPSVDQIVAALMREGQATETRGARVPFGWRRLLAIMPGVGASLLPVAGLLAGLDRAPRKRWA
jgi:mercuric ion transport protein